MNHYFKVYLSTHRLFIQKGQNKYLKILTINDYDNLINTDCLFARKFYENIANEIIKNYIKI